MQKRSQSFSTSTGNNLWEFSVFSTKMITSTGFYQCCAPGASAPVTPRTEGCANLVVGLEHADICLISYNALHDRKIFPDFYLSCNFIFQSGTQEVIL